MKTKDLFFIFLLIGLILGLRVKKKITVLLAVIFHSIE